MRRDGFQSTLSGGWEAGEWGSVCVLHCALKPTLRTLRYAAVLVPQMWLGVGGEAPGADGRVVRVAAVVLSQVLVPVPLGHESVGGGGRAAVTQTRLLRRPKRKYKATVSVSFGVVVFFNFIIFYNPGKMTVPSLA